MIEFKCLHDQVLRLLIHETSSYDVVTDGSYDL